MNLRLEHARRLLAKAREDEYVLKHLADDPRAPDAPLGFHAQQAVEKALKAVLAAHGVEYPLTHNLAMLAAALAEANCGAPPDAADLPRLTPFGVALRYDEEGEPSDVELERPWVVSCVGRTLAWADAKIAATGEGA